jgi:hypothetical protein
MTTAKHTPGPWSASEGFPSDMWHVDMPNRAFVINVSRADADPSMVVEEVQANARLIAAAPDLLEALRDTLRDLVTVAGLPDKGKGRTAAQQAALDKARDAIRKATGETT